MSRLLVLSFAAAVLMPSVSAAASCDDAWYVSNGVTYRYSDVLDTFTSYEGRTYAIGKQGGPLWILSSQYGAMPGNTFWMVDYFQNTLHAFPPAPDVTLNAVITNVFGAKITYPGIYLGMVNRNDGKGLVSMSTGTAIGWKNFTAPPYDGPYVYMDAHGAWHSTVDGSMNLVFEFPSVFDCAQPYDATKYPAASAGGCSVAGGGVSALGLFALAALRRRRNRAR